MVGNSFKVFEVAPTRVFMASLVPGPSARPQPVSYRVRAWPSLVLLSFAVRAWPARAGAVEQGSWNMSRCRKRSTCLLCDLLPATGVHGVAPTARRSYVNQNGYERENNMFNSAYTCFRRCKTTAKQIAQNASLSGNRSRGFWSPIPSEHARPYIAAATSRFRTVCELGPH